MIFDRNLQMSNDQQLLATGYSTDTLDLGQTSPLGFDDLNFVTVISAESGIAPTISVELQHSTDNSTFTTVTTLSRPTGKKIFGFGLQNLRLNRYIRCRYVIGGTNPDFTVTTGFVAGVQDWAALPDSSKIY